jgi:hypothetical protein
LTQKYTAYTLIDITNSGVTSPRSSDNAGYNQHQNLNTIIQLIGLRSQPLHYSVALLETQDLVNFNFGKQFSGLHNVWKFEFVSEHSDVYSKDNDPVYFLTEDCDGVAFTSHLNETVTFSSNTFETKDKDKLNIYFLKYV